MTYFRVRNSANRYRTNVEIQFLKLLSLQWIKENFYGKQFIHPAK